MDFDQKELYQNYSEKLPYYMAYSMQNVYEQEQEYARELERMRQLYPAKTWGIQQRIEDMCDRMEYEGSTMFDPYPDRVRLHAMVHEIYDQVSEKKDPPGKRKEELWNLIEVMLYHEMYLRRCRHKRCRRFW